MTMTPRTSSEQQHKNSFWSEPIQEWTQATKDYEVPSDDLDLNGMCSNVWESMNLGKD